MVKAASRCGEVSVWRRWVPEPPVVAILSFALLVGLLVVYKHRGDTLAGLVDEAEYNRLALDLLAGRGYDSTYWLPGYPAFIAMVYAAAGERLVAVFAAQAVLFAVCLWMVYRIACQITQDRAVSLLTLALCALWWPFYTNLIPRMLTEMLASVLIAAFLLSFCGAVQGRGHLWSVLAGVLLALASLTKAVIAVFILPASAYLAFSQGLNRRRAVSAVLFVCSAALVIVPWTVRNHNVTGDFVLIATGGGYNFWLGNHPEVFRRRVLYASELVETIREQLDGKTAVEQDRVFTRLAIKRMRDNPAGAASIFAQKFSKLWLGKLGLNPRTAAAPITAVGDFGIPPGSLTRAVLFVLAVVGWLTMPRLSLWRAVPLAGFLVLWTLVYVIVVAEPRYAYPVQFYEIMFAAAAIVAGLRGAARLRSQKAVVHTGKI